MPLEGKLLRIVAEHKLAVRVLRLEGAIADLGVRVTQMEQRQEQLRFDIAEIRRACSHAQMRDSADSD